MVSSSESVARINIDSVGLLFLANQCPLFEEGVEGVANERAVKTLKMFASSVLTALGFRKRSSFVTFSDC